MAMRAKRGSTYCEIGANCVWLHSCNWNIQKATTTAKNCEPMKRKKETTWMAIVPEIRTLNTVWEINTQCATCFSMGGTNRRAKKNG